MRTIALIEVYADDQGLVLADVRTPRGIGTYVSNRFATVDALLHAVAPLVSELRKDVDPSQIFLSAKPIEESP